MDASTAVAQLLAAIEKIPVVGPVIAAAVPLAMSVIVLCSVIATKLPAPKATTGAYYWVYTVINWGAFAFGHATSLSAPGNAGIVGGPTAIEAPRLSTASIPATGSIAKA